MNCKQNDIAVIVGFGDATGYIREAMLKAMGIPRRLVKLRPPHRDGNCTADFVWSFDEPLIVHVECIRVTIFGAADHVLRPLRDTDGEDQMLRIAGKPKSAEDLAVRISTLREEFGEACRKVVES